MWSKKATALAGGGLFLSLAGLVLLNYLFIGVGIVMLTFLMLSSFLNLWMPRVSVTRETTADNIFEGGEITVRFKLRNRGIGHGFVEIYDELPPQARLISGSNYALTFLRARQETSFEYTIKVRLRGFYHLGPVRLRVKDAFDQFYRERLIDSQHDFSVFPQIEELGSEMVQSRYPKLYQGAMVVHAVGSGTQFYSLREFFPGDSMRKVNWKAFARTGKLMVNETEREDIMDVYLVLDARSVSGVGLADENPLEMQCRALVSIASHYLKARNNVALTIYGERLQTIHLDRGDQQLFRILTALAGAKPAGDLTLKLVLEDLLPHVNAHSPIILFSSLDNDPTIVSAVTNTISMGYELFIISPSSLDIEARLGRLPEAPLRVARIERENIISEVRGYGAQVADWHPGDPVNATLQEVGG